LLQVNNRLQQEQSRLQQLQKELEVMRSRPVAADLLNMSDEGRYVTKLAIHGATNP